MTIIMPFFPASHYFLTASTKYRVQMCIEERKKNPCVSE